MLPDETKPDIGGAMKKKLRGMKRQVIRLDLDLYRVRVPLPDYPDMSLSVIDLWPEQVDRTLLFVHGYAGCAETWEYQANHFARDYRVVIPDLRGHGQSDAPYSDYGMDEIVADLHAVVERLALPRQFILVGHSFGGSICVEYANRYPERIEKLVLIATAGEYPLPRAVAFALRVPPALYRPLWKYRPLWNAEIHTMRRMMLNNMRRWRGWPLLRQLSMPTLVIMGERDNYFPRYVYEEVAKMIPGAEIVDIGSAKHKVQLERHQAVNRAIDRFIRNNRHGSWRDLSTASRLAEQRPWLSNYSQDTPFTIPIPRQPLHSFLESAADSIPRRTAILFYGKTLSYHQLNAQVNQFAHALVKLGLRAGDRVMLVLPNVPQFVVAFYAALKIGCVVVLPNPDAGIDGLVEQARDTQARVLVTLAESTALAQAALTDGAVEHVVLASVRSWMKAAEYRQVMDLLARTGLISCEPRANVAGAQTMSALMRGEPDHDLERPVTAQDLAVIAYTGGTSAAPRGVCLTHHNLVANTLQNRHWFPGMRYGHEVFLCALPLLHSYGMTSAMNVPVALGAQMILVPVPDVAQILHHIRLYRPSVLPGAPSIYTDINHAENVRTYGLSSIKACMSGSAPLPVEVQEEFEKLTRGRLIEGYGLTEASPVTHANPLGGQRKVASIGVPLPNTDAKIVCLETGEDVPEGVIGELALRGPQVMRGYWNGAAHEPGDSELRDGWLLTGDIAVMDADGYFRVIGRKSDTIWVDGQPVYPRDIEELIYEHPKVLEVCVVGVHDPRAGQRPVAFVVPNPDAALTEEELLELCRRRLEPRAVPVRIELRRALPKSYIGKVIRRRLLSEAQGEGNDG